VGEGTQCPFSREGSLQRKTATLLQEKTGYQLVAGNGAPPMVYADTTGALFFKTVLDLAFAPPQGMDLDRVISDLKSEITIDPTSGEVKYRRGLILAAAPGNWENTKKNLLDAFRSLAKSAEVMPVVDTYQTLEEITAKARRMVKQIRLLGLVPGQCEICRRLGM